MNKHFACSFSGHRKEEFDFDKSIKGDMFKRFLKVAIKEAIDKGCDTFYCGMAQGFDIIAAEALISIKERDNLSNIRLISVMPYKNQHKKWGASWRKRHEFVLENSNEVIVLEEKYFTGCYHQRNRYLVDNAQMLICYYNGSAGGTKHTVEYAEQKGLEIINVLNLINPRSLLDIVTK